MDNLTLEEKKMLTVQTLREGFSDRRVVEIDANEGNR